MNVGFRSERTLQATLSGASASGNNETTAVKPHHPINCASPLRLEPDGTFSCDHVSVPGGDDRTRSCVNHSLALLLLELACEL